MEALKMYGDSSDSDEESDSITQPPSKEAPQQSLGRIKSLATKTATILPPPPIDLLSFPSAFREMDGDPHRGRVRSFPHVEGNFALHVYIPVTVPSNAKSKILPLFERAAKRFPDLHLLGDESADVSAKGAFISKFGGEYHISLSRTVAVRVHQIDSVVSMLRRRFSSQNRYFAEFGSWEVFTNDERTRTFLSLEVIKAGVCEMQTQVRAVDEVLKLHNLPTFYKDPRPHISIGWAVGDVSIPLKTVADDLNNYQNKELLWSSQVKKVECKAGQRVYVIWE
ncbi:hypothetical protein Mapa_015433 [Marchantia paleacea]|nr:hypothetical protein Mapa_015433 [Marchantia paleacea]